jgi:hypothetical protein
VISLVGTSFITAERITATSDSTYYPVSSNPYQPVKIRNIGEIDTKGTNGRQVYLTLEVPKNLGEVRVTVKPYWGSANGPALSKITDLTKRIEIEGIKPDEFGIYSVTIPFLFYPQATENGKFSIFEGFEVCLNNIMINLDECKFDSKIRTTQVVYNPRHLILEFIP